MGDINPAAIEGDPEYVAPVGDPHGDEVLEGGPQDAPIEPELPLVPEPVAGDPPGNKVTLIPPKKPAPDWRDIDRSKLRDKLRAEREAMEALAAENRRLTDLTESLARQPPQEPPEGQQPPPAPRQPPGERVYTKAELDAEAERIADAKVQRTVFQNDFDGAYKAGTSAFGKDKMDEAIGRISELGGLDVDHLEFVLASDEPGRVLFELGSKPEEFQRIMELPFKKRAAEFIKMGLKTETPGRKVSNTPPPVEPLGGSGGSSDNRYDDKAGDAAWFAAEERRAEQYHKRKRNY